MLRGLCSFSLLCLITFGLKLNITLVTRISPRTSSSGNRCVCLSVRVHVCRTLVCEPSTEVSTSSCVVLGRVLQLWESEPPHPLMQGGGGTHHPRECHWDDVIPTVIVGVVTVRQTCVKWLHHTLATGCTTLCDLHCVAWLSVPVATGHPVVCCNHTRSCSPNMYMCVCVVSGCEGCVLNKFLSTYIDKRFSSFMYKPLPSHPLPSHPVSCSPLPSHRLLTHPLPSHPLPSPPVQMDDHGYVPIHIIARFNRVRSLCPDFNYILECIGSSSFLETNGHRVRRREGWEQWLIITSPRSEGAGPSFDGLRAGPLEADFAAGQQDADVSPLSSGSSGSQNKATGQFEAGIQNSPEEESPQEWQEVQRRKSTGSSTKEERRVKVGLSACAETRCCRGTSL